VHPMRTLSHPSVKIDSFKSFGISDKSYRWFPHVGLFDKDAIPFTLVSNKEKPNIFKL
jgi:hypothetical protein